MAKVWKYVFISVGLITLLRFSGLPIGNEQIFDMIGLIFEGTTGVISSFNSTDSSMFRFLFAVGTGILITLAVSTTAAAVSFVTRAQFENIILVPFITSVLVLFVSSGYNVITYTLSLGQGWISSIVVLLMLPFTVGFILALGEFFRGTD
ncbi:hypothetical protein LCGC14_2188530 [marine sediment metagenome]|uniref:Uncharacterized protein n=1 Tax=marine sediment metagenome TaxID=412755 RepID=A0A0F8W239_9ZZZZ